jgi:hypothetical protein
MKVTITDKIKPYYDAILKAAKEDNENMLKIAVTCCFWSGYDLRESEFLEENKDPFNVPASKN